VTGDQGVVRQVRTSECLAHSASSLTANRLVTNRISCSYTTPFSRPPPPLTPSSPFPSPSATR